MSQVGGWLPASARSTLGRQFERPGTSANLYSTVHRPTGILVAGRRYAAMSSYCGGGGPECGLRCRGRVRAAYLGGRRRLLEDAAQVGDECQLRRVVQLLPRL